MQEISVFNLFSIGIGPSSSHTVGPMKAAYAFRETLLHTNKLMATQRINIELFGSLAHTGLGHGTDRAVIMGLAGYLPDSVDPASITPFVAAVTQSHTLALNEQKSIPFDPTLHIIYERHTLLPKHSNGLRFSAHDAAGNLLCVDVYYSIGGGFIVQDQETEPTTSVQLTYPFETAQELLAHCTQHHLSIAQLMMINETAWRTEAEIKRDLLHIIDVMQTSLRNAFYAEGPLPGRLKVKRRAPLLFQKLQAKGKPDSHQSIDSMDWLNLYAIAVNESNASGDRVVTAPTNGAAGIIPAVLTYYQNFYEEASDDKLVEFMLTAGAIALLYKKRASISGAEVGCQGEVGVACSMAAGALTAVLGGTLAHIENAAEIAMEHHLGMTCDPIAGLVQIPCIERNAMGAVKAVNSTRLALMGDGTHYVSLDDVIKTMKQTGKDMLHTYKETSQAGLAVNVTEC